MEDIIKFLGGSVVLLGAVSYLIKTIVSQQLAKELALYRTEIQAKNSLELEKFKHNLYITATDYEKRIQILHEKRANIIAELYSKLVEFINTAGNYAVDPGEPGVDNSKAIECLKYAKALNSHIDLNRIYFTEEVCRMIDSLSGELAHSITILSIRLRATTRGYEKDYQKYDEAWDKTLELINEKVPKLKKAIEEEFRLLVGVIKDKPISNVEV